MKTSREEKGKILLKQYSRELEQKGVLKYLNGLSQNLFPEI